MHPSPTQNSTQIPPPPADKDLSQYVNQENRNLEPSPKRKKGTNGFKIISILLVILLLSTTIYVFSLRNDYNKLSSEQSELQEQRDKLDEELQSLQKNYSNLDRQKASLESNYSSLDTSYNTLQMNYEELTREHISLQDQYDSLEKDYNVETSLQIGHLLSDYYDVVRDEYRPQPSYWWISQDEPTQQEFVDFGADLAKHGLGEVYWPDIENDFYERSELAYGYKTHSYERARTELINVKNLIGIGAGDDNATKIEKILDFVNDNVHYENDMKGNFLAPMETLTLGSGDCEDYSILVGALFELVGIDSALAFNDTHAFLLVRVNGLGEYNSQGYGDLTNYGLAPGKWTIIEPQVRIEDQYAVTSNYIFNFNVVGDI